MNETLPPTSNHSIDRLIAEYLQAIEAGKVPSREELLAQHPYYAEELRRFFADFDRVDRGAASLRFAGPNTSDYTDTPPGTLPTVRYFGDYELLEEIARGGMGIVYKARQVLLSRLVALKMLLKGEHANAKDAARFQAEAEAAAGLDHPNIVPIYEIGTHEGRQYLAMKFIEGKSLAKVDRSDARTEAARLLTIAKAVHFAHQRGVLHRDLKPGNILVDDASIHYVADFGLAKRVDAQVSLSETGDVIGTPRYMAPEQANGKKGLTTAVDTYALGVILYERLTGRTPHQGQTLLEVLRQLREETPANPRSLVPTLDRDLETICVKCLEKEPGRRYASSGELADDLQRWIDGKPIQARPAGWMERAMKWVKRRPAVAALYAVTLLAVLAAMVGVWYHVRQITEQIDLRDIAYDELKKEQKTTSGLLVKESSARQQLTDALAREQKTSYVYRIPLAARELAANNVARTRELLEQSPEHLRGWEWYYLKRLCGGNALEIPTPRGGWQEFVLSRDGKQIIAGQSKDIVFYDTENGTELKRWPAHAGPIRRLVINREGTRLATMYGPQTDKKEKKEVKIWNLVSGELIHTLTIESTELLSVAFSRDGSRLACSGREPEIAIWNVETGKELRRLPAGAAFSLAYAEKGLVVGQWQQGITIWDDQKGKLLETLKGRTEPISGTWCVTASADGKYIAGATNHGRVIRVWEKSSEKPMLEMQGSTDIVNKLQFNQDNTQLISGGDDQTLKIWDLVKGTYSRIIRGHASSVRCVAYSPGDKLIYSSGTDRTIRAWPAHADLGGFQLTDEIITYHDLAFHPSGETFATAAGEYSVKFWDMKTRKVLAVHGDKGYPRQNRGDLAYHPNGSLLASTWGATTVKIWDTKTFKEVISIENLGKVSWKRPLCFQPEGDLIAIAVSETDIELRNIRDGKLVKTLRGHKANGLISCMRWLNDSPTLISSAREIILWDIETGQPRKTLQPDYEVIVSFDITRDESRLVAFSAGGEVSMWSLTDGKKIFKHKAHAQRAIAVVLTKDDKRYVTMAENGQMHFWDAELGQELYSVRLNLLPSVLKFSPDGRYLVCAGMHDKIHFLDSASVEPVRPSLAITSGTEEQRK